MLLIEQVFSAINESRITTSAGALGSVTSSAVPAIDTNQTFSISITSPNPSSRSDSPRLCSRDELRIGSWKQQVLDAPPYLPKTVHLQCYPDSEYKAGEWTHTYEWQPSASLSKGCAFTDWNQSEFCRLMKRATILIIGDSLSFEQYRSLGHLLGIHISQFSQHESKAEEKNIVNYACRKQTRLVFRRDDLLSNVSHAIFEEKAFPQVIVMNRGAHYKTDAVLMEGMQKVAKELEKWKSQCAIFNITCHLFWRTSVPGHPKCEDNNFTEPVNDIRAMEALINNRSNYNERTMQYHWFDYQHQNELVVDMLTSQETLERATSAPFFLEIIDAYYLNVLRPDEHRSRQGDCLHNCYPGKMDVYSQLLLHFLKIQRSQGDIDSLIAWQDSRAKL
eukprot:jgi/Psemu1/189160/e_gw1.85.151.1